MVAQGLFVVLGIAQRLEVVVAVVCVVVGTLEQFHAVASGGVDVENLR